MESLWEDSENLFGVESLRSRPLPISSEWLSEKKRQLLGLCDASGDDGDGFLAPSHLAVQRAESFLLKEIENNKVGNKIPIPSRVEVGPNREVEFFWNFVCWTFVLRFHAEGVVSYTALVHIPAIVRCDEDISCLPEFFYWWINNYT